MPRGKITFLLLSLLSSRAILIVPAMLVVCAIATPSGAQEIESNTRLSSLTVIASAPVVALASNGDCTAVWQETRALPFPAPLAPPNEAIVVRRRINGTWENAETLADTLEVARKDSTLGQPALALDPKGRPTAVWVQDSQSGASLQYAFFNGSQWIPATIESELKIESPVVAFLPAGPDLEPTVFFAWEERRGSSDRRIHTTVIDPTGDDFLRIPSGGPATMTYVTYPEFFILAGASPGDAPRMGLCWFNLEEEDQVRIEMRVWDDFAHDWRPFPTPTWNPLLLLELPLVTATLDQGPFLIGYKAADLKNRIFISSDSTALTFLDDGPNAQNWNPSTSRPWKEQIGLVWLQETRVGTNLLRAALRPSGDIFTLPPIPVDYFLPSQPDIAVTGERLATVWISLAPETQTPAVHFAEYALDSPEWCPLLMTEE